MTLQTDIMKPGRSKFQNLLRCLPCRTCTAILNSLAMTGEGWACFNDL